MRGGVQAAGGLAALIVLFPLCPPSTPHSFPQTQEFRGRVVGREVA